MPICLKADEALTACKKGKRDPTAEEAQLIAEAKSIRDKLVQVDVHDNLGVDAFEERPALVGTVERQKKAGVSFEAVTMGAQAAA